MKNKLRSIILAVFLSLIFLGILIRSIEVINKNYIFGFDHGREYLTVRDIVDYKDIKFVGAPLGGGSAGFDGIFHGPGHFYFLAIPYILFNGDPYGGVVLMFVFGVGSLILMFILSRKLTNIYGAFLATALLALSPPIISQSRFFWSPNPSTFFALIAFIAVYNLKNGKKWAFLAGFASAFVYNFEFAIAVPLVLTLFIYSVWIFGKKGFRNILLVICGGLTAILPAIFFEVRHNFLAIRGLFSYFTNKKPPSESYNFIDNQIDHLNSFLFNIVDTFPNKDIINPIFVGLILFIPLYILFRTNKKSWNNFINYLLILIPVTFLSFVVLRNTVYQYYLFHLVIVYILIFSFATVKLFESKKYLLFALLSTFVAIQFFTSIPNFYKVFMYDINDYGGDAKIRGKIDAIDYIYKDAKGEKFGLLVFTPPVYTYAYDYVLYWYADKKYGYTPYKEKKGTVYLLMEKDLDKPWSYKGWLETVIRDRTIIGESTLPSGFIVQKRIFNVK